MTKLRTLNNLKNDTLRRDAYEKVTGRATYTTDITLPGMLHAKVLRSPEGHARILNIDSSFANERVIIAGDLNDELTDNFINNVFQSFIDDTANYLFTDMLISQGNSTDWSYPTWPSHLDHILITNELFADFSESNSEIRCIRIDDYMNSWNQYDNNISDHRPVGIKLEVGNITSNIELDKNNTKLIKIVDILGKEVGKNTKGILFYIYDNGTMEKRIIVE